MKSISRWAKNHVPQARILLVLIKTGLWILAIYLGLLITNMGYFTPGWFLYIIAALAAYSFYSYPHRQYTKHNFYRKQKTRDFLLGLCAFCIIAGVTNRLDMPLPQSGTIANASSIMHIGNAAQIITSLEHRNKKTLSRKEKQILKKEFFQQVKVYAKATLLNDKAAKADSWKIILVIVAMLGLLYLIAGLACSLSCSGSEAAAAVLFILGFTAVIWGAAALFKRIKRGPPAKTTTAQE